MAAPADSPQAAVVAAHLAALRAADVAALRATVSERLALQLDAPGFGARLEVMSHLAPDAYAVAALAEEGERAALDVETERQVGRFELVRESGEWKVAGQSWQAKERETPS